LAAAFGGQVILALGLGLLLLTFRFWRDPERSPPQEEGVVLSAADGEVVYVRHVDGADAPLVTKGNRTFSLDELTGARLLVGGAWMVGVGMSFLDVHVNRSPIHGRVRFKKDVPGEFFSLRKEEAPFLNARMTTVIENTSLSVVVVQVASRLVRRVQSYVEVELGERVTAGLSVLARYGPDQSPEG
jgi:phosphatidylserine decarboxylase